MDLRLFLQDGALRSLALASLSRAEYKVLLYLLDTAAHDSPQALFHENEWARLLACKESEIIEAIQTLLQRQLITVHEIYVGANSSPLGIRIQEDTSKWRLGNNNNHHTLEASEDIKLPSLPLEIHRENHWPETTVKNPKNRQACDKILRAFLRSRLHGERDWQDLIEAEPLLEERPLESILVMIQHFGLRLPSLEALRKDWGNYQKIFDRETQQVDWEQARRKHKDLDQKLKKLSSQWLKDAENLQLSEDEIAVLNLLKEHKHPRRQLFWAYRARSRYHNLREFFEKSRELQLGITSSGIVLKKRGD